MNNIGYDIAKTFISQKKYEALVEFSKIENPDKPGIIINEYAGDGIRLYKNNKNNIVIACPENITTIQEGYLASALTDGSLFDDADTIDNSAKYLQNTVCPNNCLINKGYNIPKALTTGTACVIGKMDDHGRFNADDADIANGYNYIKDMIHSKDNCNNVKEIVDNYLGNQEHKFYNKDLGIDISALENEINSLADVTPDDEITDDDFEVLKLSSDDSDDDEDDEYEQEGFLTKKPKKLKPIPIRDIVSYITIEIGAIQDSNDQAMLSGYTCSKLELVDFYLNVIDTQDERYIVPHDRNYLIAGQKQLNDLLTQILRIRPINRNDRVWRVNVNYPDGWRG